MKRRPLTAAQKAAISRALTAYWDRRGRKPKKAPQAKGRHRAVRQRFVTKVESASHHLVMGTDGQVHTEVEKHLVRGKKRWTEGRRGVTQYKILTRTGKVRRR